MAGRNYQPLTLTPVNFSLTEGTSIPAPLDSPPDTPRPPTPGKGPLSSHPTPISGVFPQHRNLNTTESAADSVLRPTTSFDAASSTLSPTSPTNKRPGSVRKFLGLRTLSSSDSLNSDRPGSPATVDSKPSLSRKKSGSWFSKRKSTFAIGSVPEGKENQTPKVNGHAISKPAPLQEKKGPPPPALPELKSFGVSEDTTSLGADDMFKNIK
ncbi:hypothetical protein K505DRAFT_326833 [Melanomma pulvis-pyrius CBS 109.77]|uniref:Uncharacterized protein n=1 Tax=Melanomma pulvis-pyrius CBS 109.77 TaxID=1314802 RepID=A0A6A6X590_9PLEO|nr:hypothetical protein K505DRAFT_326833 [Melanomma pulvis-pyrius CBS 109.77]